VPKNERQQGKRRVLGSNNEILHRKHLKKTLAFFSSNQFEIKALNQQNVRKQKNDSNVSSAFLVEIV